MHKITFGGNYFLENKENTRNFNKKSSHLKYKKFFLEK